MSSSSSSPSLLSARREYLDYWREETQRLKFNLEYLQVQIKNNHDDIYWIRCNLSRSGALHPNVLMNLDSKCCLVQEYLITFCQAIEDEEFKGIFCEYGQEAALKWASKLIDGIVRPLIERQDTNQKTSENHALRDLALVTLYKLIEPTRGAQSGPNDKDSRLDEALQSLARTRRYRSKEISKNLLRSYLKKSFKQRDQLGIFNRPSNQHDKDEEDDHEVGECQHSFQDVTDGCKNQALWQEINRMNHILVPAYPCDSTCKERIIKGRAFVNINCRPSRLAYFVRSSQVARVFLAHPFTRDGEWREHDSKHLASWPCRCLDLLHDEDFIRGWITFIKDAQPVLSKNATRRCDVDRRCKSTIQWIINQYGPPTSTFRSELKVWIGRLHERAQHD